MIQKKTVKIIAGLLLFGFLFLNVIAFFHAYKFTHFTADPVLKTQSPAALTFAGKLKTILFGVSNPRPVNHTHPTQPYKTIFLQSNKKIECWLIKAPKPKGTVLLFHGYGGQKASLLDKSDEFLKLGYNTFLVDFMGSGGSAGNQTTIGFYEAEQVKTAYEYIARQGDQNIFLFGTSLGAVATLKALADYKLSPAGIIIECPFGSMYQTTKARFDMMQVPAFPMAGLLVFWGGIQNGFWAFSHNPTEYARHITTPTLLLYGGQDKKVSREETNAIYQNLQGPKTLKIYTKAGHENYLLQYKSEWTADVSQFLGKNSD